MWQLYAKRLIGVRLWDVCKDTIPFALISAAIMVAIWFITANITNSYLLLFLRILLAVILYAAIMRLLKVKMMEECIQFIKGQLRSKV